MEVRQGTTTTEPLQAKETPSFTSVQWQEPVKRSRAEALTKNLAVAAALLICIVALRQGAAPSSAHWADAVLTAATNDTLLDDRLGKLTFVSTLFPEATLVFGEANADLMLTMPVTGGEIVHTWSEDEPYTAWSSAERMVYSAVDGEVMGVYHGDDEEMTVHVQRSDGISCLCGNMSKVLVTAGDAVTEGMLLGYLAEDSACFFEVRQDGWSIDPTQYLTE